MVGVEVESGGTGFGEWWEWMWRVVGVDVESGGSRG